MHRVQIQDSMQKGKNSGPIPTLSCNLIIHLSSCFIFELGFVLDVALHYICEVYGICLYQIRAYMHCIKSIYTNLNLTYNTNLTTQNINYNSYNKLDFWRLLEYIAGTTVGLSLQVHALEYHSSPRIEPSSDNLAHFFIIRVLLVGL